MGNFFLIPEFFLIINFIILMIFVLGKKINIYLFSILNAQQKLNKLILLNLIDYFIFLFLSSIVIIIILYDQVIYFSFFSIYCSKLINFAKILIISFSFIIFFISKHYFLKDFNFKSIEFFIFLSISLISMLFLISSNDFLTLYLSLELQSLSLYILSGFKQTSILAIEGGLKYFLLGSFSSGLLIFGISIIYGITGTLNFDELKYIFYRNTFFENQIFMFLGILLICCTLLFKFTAAPFHMWSPDVYEGVSTLVTFYFSTIPKIVFYVLIDRLFNDILNSYANDYVNIFYISCILSLLIGSFSTLYQTKLKRFLAYSSINNIGFFLITIILSSKENILAGLFYLTIYLITVSGIFYFLLSIHYFSNNLKLKNINELLGFLNNNFFYLIFFLINFFSFIGMPPLNGFIGKFFLFFSVLLNELFLLFLIACFSSIFTTVIYLKIIRLLFFNRESYFYFYSHISRPILILLFIIFFINFLMFLDSNNFIFVYSLMYY